MLSCTWLAIGYSCCPSPDWLPVAFQAPIEFQRFKDIHVVTLLLLEQKGGLHDIGTSAGRFRIDCSYFGWKLDWNSVLRFSHKWELTQKTGIEILKKKKKKEPNGFSCDENPILVHWFLLFFFSHGAAAIGSSCSSSHWGLPLFSSCYYFFPLTPITLLPLLFFSLYCYYLLFFFFGCYNSSLIITFLSLLLFLFSHGVVLCLGWSN